MRGPKYALAIIFSLFAIYNFNHDQPNIGNRFNLRKYLTKILTEKKY